MSAAPVLTGYAGGVGWITFNRPEAMNAVDVPMAVAFRDAVRALNATPGIKVIVLTGAGRAFMAGGDLASFRRTDDKPGFAHELITPIHEALVALAEGPAVSIASVGGAAAGAGMSVALAADLCVAAENASFTTAYAGVAAPGDCGITWALPAMVGPRKAMELMLLSPRLSAAEAAALGLVNHVVADDALEAETDRLAARLARGPAFAMGQIKALIRRPAASYAAHLDAERAGFAACAGEADFDEALAAFFARRAPDFRAE
ncbi:enoyl-CoA hydratase-related protein [Sinisalibacter aestuarii]|uniref:Enoyl-CoA hydratase n=1 Tax=Sinisalibacter aestuarii TaxID=2949426 RepID=A0ABQ5LYD2_9RHOB|nr:enoyl-CoA hydratase-related protein [Sinisalibacter aestuarii]GKY89974.1 enoyl-CoA hydratase [Sinisalibacter aestuarii]